MMTSCGREFAFSASKDDVLINAALVLRGCIGDLALSSKAGEAFILSDVSDDDILRLGLLYPEENDEGAIQQFLNDVFEASELLRRYNAIRVAYLRPETYHCDIKKRVIA